MEENKVYKLTSIKEDEMATTTAPLNHATEWLRGCSHRRFFFLKGQKKKEEMGMQSQTNSQDIGKVTST